MIKILPLFSVLLLLSLVTLSKCSPYQECYDQALKKCIAQEGPGQIELIVSKCVPKALMMCKSLKTIKAVQLSRSYQKASVQPRQFLAVDQLCFARVYNDCLIGSNPQDPDQLDLCRREANEQCRQYNTSEQVSNSQIKEVQEDLKKQAKGNFNECFRKNLQYCHEMVRGPYDCREFGIMSCNAWFLNDISFENYLKCYHVKSAGCKKLRTKLLIADCDLEVTYKCFGDKVKSQ